MSDSRKLLTSVKDRPEDLAFKVWEEPNGKITIEAGDALVVTATPSTQGTVKNLLRITQAEYDALATKDGETLYLMTEGGMYLGTVLMSGSGGGGGLTTEQVQDSIAGMLTAGSGITLTYNDVGNILTITAAGGGSATDISVTTTATDVTVVSSTGVDGVIPSATSVMAGAMPATAVTKLAGLSNYTHPASGVTIGTYKSVTVDVNGHVTAGTNPTTLAGYGITDAAPSSHTGTGAAAHAAVTTSVNGFMTSADKVKLDAAPTIVVSVSAPANPAVNTIWIGV